MSRPSGADDRARVRGTARASLVLGAAIVTAMVVESLCTVAIWLLAALTCVGIALLVADQRSSVEGGPLMLAAQFAAVAAGLGALRWCAREVGMRAAARRTVLRRVAP